jgi:tight adherence protein C
MILLASILAAASFGLIAWTVADIALCPRVVSERDGRFERERRSELRKSNSTYRLCEPLIDDWNRLWKFKSSKLAEVEEYLKAAGVREPWKPEEYLNAKRIEGIFIAIGSFLVCLTIVGSSLFGSMLFSLIIFQVQQALTVRTLKSQAVIRQMAMKRRFAGAIDLMALMMEVGAGFQECLDVAARESKNTPLGEELSLVQKEISMGALRGKALAGLAERTRDPDMSEVIISINEGEELGTPLTSILRNQADQMREKRSQWAEKAAEESQVAIVFPAMLIMVACLLIVVAPFVVTVIAGGGAP